MTVTRSRVRAHPVPPTKYTIQVDHAEAGTVSMLSIASGRELLELVLQAVGPQALREFTLEHLSSEQLTTQQAADLLGMSRPTLIKLVDRGVLPHTMVGNRRYLPLQAVEDYRRRNVGQLDAQAGRAPDEVIAENLRFLQQLAEEEGDFA